MQLDECSQNFQALLEQKSRILGQVSEAEFANLERGKHQLSEYKKKNGWKGLV